MKELEKHWHSLCSRIELDGEQQWEKLVSAYTDSDLAYHNLTHIEDCLLLFMEHSELATDPLAVELAIWFHDIIYDPRKQDNEELSAKVSIEFLKETIFADTVSKLILATKHNSLPHSQDTKLICDIDLSILGRAPSRYKTYAKAIRQEYAWVPESDYIEGRIRILKSFLGRKTIFGLPEFSVLFEEQARENLNNEIVTLETTNTPQP